MRTAHYNAWQICTNGHSINNSASDYPVHNQRHCHICGAETIMKCPSCGAMIRGHYYIPNVAGFTGPTKPPLFCHECSAPYPWHVARLEAAKELVDLADKLSADEKKALKDTLGDLASETPRTKIAIVRWKSALGRIAEPIGNGLRDILVDIMAEAVKKQMFGE